MHNTGWNISLHVCIPSPCSTWVRDWQTYQRAGSKGTRPQPLSQAMLPLLCSCHPHDPHLSVKLPDITIKRNK